MNRSISVANLVMLSGGVVCALFSFFNFYEYGGTGRSAWSSDALAFVSTIPAILAIVMVAWCVAEVAGAKLPADVLTFNPTQLKATWGISAAGVMLAFFTVDGPDKGIGFWLMTLGSLAMAAGSIMALLGKGSEAVNFGQSGSAQAPPPPPPPPPPGG